MWEDLLGLIELEVLLREWLVCIGHSIFLMASILEGGIDDLGNEHLAELALRCLCW